MSFSGGRPRSPKHEELYVDAAQRRERQQGRLARAMVVRQQREAEEQLRWQGHAAHVATKLPGASKVSREEPCGAGAGVDPEEAQLILVEEVFYNVLRGFQWVSRDFHMFYMVLSWK